MVNEELAKKILAALAESNATVEEVGITLNWVMQDVQARAEFGVRGLKVGDLVPSGSDKLPQEYQAFYQQIHGLSAQMPELQMQQSVVE